jgi:molybdopterin/thiamine biosynthesis adenylyltransferase
LTMAIPDSTIKERAVNYSDMFVRQQDFLNLDVMFDLTFGLVGCGSLGSAIGLALAKSGARKWVLWDGDTVESHNLPNQFFFAEQLTALLQASKILPAKLVKSKTLAGVMQAFTPIPLSVQARHHYHNDNPRDKSLLDSCDVVITGTDSLESRSIVYSQYLESKDKKLFVDCRSGGLYLSFYCLHPRSSKAQHLRYVSTLKGGASELPCTAKAISYMSMAAGAFVPALVRNYLMGEPTPSELYLDATKFQLVELRVE